MTDTRIRIVLLIGILWLAGCSSSTTPTSGAETPPAQPTEQAASAPSVPPQPEPVGPHKRTAPAGVPPTRAKDVTVAVPASEPPNLPDVIAPVVLNTGPVQPVSDRPAPPIPLPLPAPPERTTRQLTIPQGTMIVVRTSDPIDSATAKVGQTFRGALDAPLTAADGDTLAPQGTDVDLRLTAVDSAGKLAGQSKLSLEVERISVAGKSYPISTEIYEKQATSQTQQTAKRTGIGAGIGALIGAIAGGGKGAAIGAGVGGGAGVAVEAAGKSNQVHIDSETRLEFRLQQPLEVTVESKTPAGATNTTDSSPGPRLLAPAALPANNGTTSHDLSGKWRIAMESPQGNRSMQMTLTQTADQLQGTLDNRGRTESLKGTIHGDSFSFSTAADTDEAPVLRFEGRILNDKLQGTMTRNGGGYRSSRGSHGSSGERNNTQAVTWSADRAD